MKLVEFTAVCIAFSSALVTANNGKLRGKAAAKQAVLPPSCQDRPNQVNLSLNRPTSQSTDWDAFFSDNAVDGDMNTFQQTASERNGGGPNTWSVFLDEGATVDSVTLYRRQDGAYDGRYSNFTVSLKKDGVVFDDYFQENEMADGTKISFCGEEVDEVEIRNDGAPLHELQFAEVVVMGVVTDPLSTPTSYGIFPLSFGEDVGDVTFSLSDDGASGPFALPSPMTFFGEAVTHVDQSVNGFISCGGSAGYTPQTIPSSSVAALVAAYWIDINTARGGADRNMLYARATTDANDLARASATVNGGDEGTSGTTFEATAAFVATWYKVEQYGRTSDEIVTFQATIAYNADVTWVILSYDVLEFGVGTVIGFNGFNGEGFMVDQISSSSEMTGLVEGSNCGRPGTYVFSVHGTPTQSPTASPTEEDDLICLE